MKFLLDENLSLRQAAALRVLGYDAISVSESGLGGQPDDTVRASAIESGRVLITLDADFGNILRYPPADTPGVIRLKIHPPTETAIQERLHRTLQLLKDTQLAGCLAISDGKTIRIRR